MRRVHLAAQTKNLTRPWSIMLFAIEVRWSTRTGNDLSSAKVVLQPTTLPNLSFLMPEVLLLERIKVLAQLNLLTLLAFPSQHI